MNYSLRYFKEKLTQVTKNTDLVFLIFLLMVLHVSLAVKLAGVALIYILRPDFKFRLREGRLPFFYILMAVFVLIHVLLNLDRGPNYYILAALGFVFWIASFLIIHQVRFNIEKQGTARIENAVKYFFILNAAVTILKLLLIVIEIRSLNPFVYIGMNYKYFASTGDHLRGITGDLSTVNMIVNGFGTFFFLYRKNYWLSALCFTVALLTTSNVGNFILFFFFLCIFIADRSRLNKSIVLCYTSFLIIFVIKVSPSNLNYLNNKAKEILHLEKPPIKRTFEDNSEKEKLISDYLKTKHKEVLNKHTDKDNIGVLMLEKKIHDDVEEQQQDQFYIKEENVSRNRFLTFYESYYGDTLTTLNKDYYDHSPGKYLSFKETFRFLNGSTSHLLIGAGPGNFSSKLAFKATNLAISGKYIEKYKYIAPEFKENHLKLTIRYYLKSVSEHSVINFPNSVLNQLLGEYGIIGLLLFFATYVWFFLKRIKKYTYGLILLPMCLLFLLTDYWFESLTIVVLFEILMFIDLAGPAAEINPETND